MTTIISEYAKGAHTLLQDGISYAKKEPLKSAGYVLGGLVVAGGLGYATHKLGKSVSEVANSALSEQPILVPDSPKLPKSQAELIFDCFSIFPAIYSAIIGVKECADLPLLKGDLGETLMAPLKNRPLLRCSIKLYPLFYAAVTSGTQLVSR